MVSLSGLTLEPKARPITGHYSKAVLYIAEDAIRDTLMAMKPEFVSDEFINLFCTMHRLRYQIIVKFYLADQPLDRSHDDRVEHAKQIAHQQIMHTVCNCFPRVVQKTGNVENRKGGDQSSWKIR